LVGSIDGYQALTAWQRQIEILYANNLDKESASLLALVSLVGSEVLVNLAEGTFVPRQGRSRPTDIGSPARGSPGALASSLAIPWFGRQILLAAT